MVKLNSSRVRQDTIPVPEYSVEFLELVNSVMFVSVDLITSFEHTNTGKMLAASSQNLAEELGNTTLVSSVFVVEPFLPDILSHSQLPSAYPFDRSTAFAPCALLLAWVDPAEDQIIEAAMHRIIGTLETALIEEGHEDVKMAPLYSNYALWDAPLDRIYGSSLPRLKEIKAKVDPENVMGLAGGFKVEV